MDDATSPQEPRGQEPEALVVQALEAVSHLSEAGLATPGQVVFEYGSPHGGTWLDLLVERRLTVATGDEPVDLIIDCFGLMHEADQNAALVERVRRLKPFGHLLLQFHSVATILTEGQWNAIRHGHFAYFSTTVLSEMLTRVGLAINRAWTFDLYGGTVLLDASKEATSDSSVRVLVEAEGKLGTSDPTSFKALQDAVTVTAWQLKQWLEKHRNSGAKIVGYGAASRAVSLLHIGAIDADLLPTIADASVAKQGRRMPGSDIPIRTPDLVFASRPDIVLVFVPDMLAEVRQAHPEVEKWGGRWAVAVPSPRLV
jgi:hypothetical protein